MPLLLDASARRTLVAILVSCYQMRCHRHTLHSSKQEASGRITVATICWRMSFLADYEPRADKVSLQPKMKSWLPWATLPLSFWCSLRAEIAAAGHEFDSKFQSTCQDVKTELFRQTHCTTDSMSNGEVNQATATLKVRLHFVADLFPIEAGHFADVWNRLAPIRERSALYPCYLFDCWQHWIPKCQAISWDDWP